MSRTIRAQRRAATLGWIARTGPVTAGALAVREGCGLASARSHLAALARAGLVRRSAPLRDAPPLYTISPHGLRTAGTRGVAPAPVSAAAAAHAIACAEVAVRLQARWPELEVIGEHAIRARERDGVPSLSCLAGTLTADGRHVTHRADLAVIGEPPLVVEVELTAKAPARLARICRAWARCSTVSGVLYVVSASAQQPVARAVAREHAGSRIAIVRLAALGVAERPH
ncbi:MAG TPA: replication-relaxation family protein [Solirubrobacteraceae bacterium]|nr:replication-relaxation family protein [Solirubrobacteraceae bacterium]